MSYMSYCMFEGTYREMERCLNRVYEHINDEAEYPVSENEIEYFRRMVKKIFYFMCDNEIVDFDTYDIDEDRLSEICCDMENVAGGGDEEDYY